MTNDSLVAGTVEVPCPVCDATKAKRLFDAKDWLFRCTTDQFGVARCQECGCGYLSPRPALHDMTRYYPSDFYWSWEGAGEALSWTDIVARRRKQLEAKAKWLEGLTPGSLLDVGAQKGEFIWFMQQRGWQVQGVELDNGVPNPANLPIEYGDFLEMDFAPASFDVVTFWAVLEHVYQPKDFIQKAARLLKPGGRLVALVTNFNSIQARVYRADDYPRHLTFFTPASARRVCGDAGLRVTRLTTDQTIFGGALSGGLVYALKRLGGYTIDEAFAEWKQDRDPELFWTQWRGRSSGLVRNASRLDRVLSWPLERVLDGLGRGFIMTFSATK
jgi:SAM-dependent methyltransferase